MTEVESTPVIEYSTEFQERALGSANKFLNSPEASSVKSREFLGINIDQTISKTLDESSNTAFHVESCGAVGSLDPDAKKTVISWLTLGEEKGDLPSGSIEILESKGQMQILAFKHDSVPITDEGFLWGGSRVLVDGTTDMKTEGMQVALSEEQAAEILARLESSQANKEQTEITAEIMDKEYRLSEAGLAYGAAIDKGNRVDRWIKIDAARRRLADADAGMSETEEKIKEKMKKKGGEETDTDETQTT